MKSVARKNEFNRPSIYILGGLSEFAPRRGSQNSCGALRDEAPLSFRESRAASRYYRKSATRGSVSLRGNFF